MPPIGPPRGVAWLLVRVLPERTRTDIMGDLEERFRRRVRDEGAAAARRWYRRQALDVVAWTWWGRRGEMTMSWTGELRQVVRGLLRTPGFTAATVMTLALGIGSTTAIFSVVNGVLLEPFPWETEGLVTIAHTTRGGDLPAHLPHSSAAHLVYQPGNRSFEAMAIHVAGDGTLTGSEGEPARIRLVSASRELLEVLRVEPALGRNFTAEEDAPEGPAVALLSHALWERRFGADPAIVGRTLPLNGRSREVVGVMPEGFHFPDPEVDLWIPVQLDPDDPGGFNVGGIGRLRTGVGPDAAQADLNRILPRISEVAPFLGPELLADVELAADVHPWVDDAVGDVRAALWVLTATVGFVLLIACANVASLLLVRAESRQREVAVRRAMGAGRGHLTTRFLLESGALCLAGGLLGVLLAGQALGPVLGLSPETLPRAGEIGLDAGVLAVAAGVTLLATLVFGWIPVLRQRGTGPVEVLRDGSRGATSGRASARWRSALVVAQVALALILLVGSGLMLRSFQRLRAVDPGFDAEGVLTFRLALPSTRYPDAESVAAFHHQLLDRLGSLPGVRSAGVTARLPLDGLSSFVDPLSVEGRPLRTGQVPPAVEMRLATPGYLDAMGIPLQAGRTLTRDDALLRTGAVLVTRRVVEMFFDDDGALGQRVAHGLQDVTGSREWSEVVGVVGDVHGNSLTEPPMGAVYYPLLTGEGVGMDWLGRDVAYAVRASGEPAALASPARDAIRSMDPLLAMAEVEPLAARVRRAEGRMAFTMVLLLLAAGSGLVLGTVGLYGVLAHVTAMRTREIGVRMALGARSSSILRMVLRQGMAVTGLGVVIGLTGAWVLSRFLGAMLYEVSPVDGFTYASVTLLLVAVSLLAVWLPARRASSVDPVRALGEG